MDYLEELKKALYDPIKESWSDAYTAQRSLRDRYPGTDAITNFIPYLGLATNTDDAIHDFSDKKYSDLPGDFGNMALNTGSTLAYTKGLHNIFKQLPSKLTGRAAALFGGLPITSYIDHYRQQQREADNLYGNMSGLDLIKQRLGNK